jgi:hypothetical protein
MNNQLSRKFSIIQYSELMKNKSSMLDSQLRLISESLLVKKLRYKPDIFKENSTLKIDFALHGTQG